MIVSGGSGIYGEDLAFFTEMFKPLVHCKKLPLVGAGYTENEDTTTFSGIIQHIRSADFSKEGDVLNKIEVPTLFTNEKIPLGYFVLDGEELYRVVKLNNWEQFNIVKQYVLETVRSVTNQKADTTVITTQGYT